MLNPRLSPEVKMINNKKRIAFLTLHFYPELNSTAQLLYELAEDLTNNGMEVAVYAKYPSTEIKEIKNIDNKGISVFWIRTSSLPKHVFIGRSINYIIFFVKLFFKLSFRRKQNILVVLSSPPFLPIVAYVLNRIKRQKFVYLVHDLYPDVAAQLGFLRRNGIVAKLWGKFNKMLIKHAEKVIVLDKIMQERIEVYADAADRKKIVIIPNWADGNLIKPIPKEQNHLLKQLGLEDKFVIMYAGNFGLTHNLEIFVKAAKLLTDTNAMFVFIGEGAKRNKLLKMVEQEKLKNVLILPYFKRSLLPFSLSMANVALIVLDKGFNGLSVPSKLYNILASGRTILAALENRGEIEEVIRNANCGIVVPPDDLRKIEETIRSMISGTIRTEIMGCNARKYFECHYERKVITSRYFQLFNKL